MDRKYKIIDKDEPGYFIHFPESLGNKLIDKSKDSYSYSHYVMNVFVKEFGIGQEDLVGFIGNTNTLVFLMSEFLESYLRNLNSNNIYPVSDKFN